MYFYDEFDRALVHERVAQFRDQVERRLQDRLTDEEFAPLRLQNGLYLQRHAYMLRVAIPYGTLSSTQLRALADIADRFDRGFGHFTTRQNIQFNWLKLEQVPELLAALAEVDMHAIQTSGNCIRNITADPFAGVADDEIADPRPVAEWLRQWSTFHPEFAHLPRKFKLAVTGSPQDRAAVFFHDIGIQITGSDTSGLLYDIIVGGGQGRTPVIGKTIRSAIREQDLLPYLTAMLRVYNLHGRRDNKYKARIKILVREIGLDAYRDQVEAELARLPAQEFVGAVDELGRIRDIFNNHLTQLGTVHRLDSVATPNTPHETTRFEAWQAQNCINHASDHKRIVVVPLKRRGHPPGDISADEMRWLSDIADRYSSGELRVTHEQNLVLPHAAKSDLLLLWRELDQRGFGAPGFQLVNDMIACPGLDYCNLANARSIPLAQSISNHFDEHAAQDIGELSIKISGCVNACGHHHAGHIGILGVEKKGQEFYQLTLGGEANKSPAIGSRLGRAVTADEVLTQLDTLVECYRHNRAEDESFIDTVNRIGVDPFKEALDAAHH